MPEDAWPVAGVTTRPLGKGLTDRLTDLVVFPMPVVAFVNVTVSV